MQQNDQKTNWLSKIWTMGADDRVKAVQKIRDDGTSSDEVLAVTKWLLPVMVMLCTGFSYLFFQQVFQEYLPTIAAMVAAAVIALAIEVMKIFMGIRAIRYLYFANPLSGVADTILFIGLMLASIGAFVFSYRNSTMGLHEYSQSVVRQEGAKQIMFSPPTQAIDAQIADARAAQKAALANKWRGTTTVDGQRLARQAEKNIQVLTEQRTAIINQAQSAYNLEIENLSQKAISTAGWSKIAGGVIELFQIVLLLIAASCEKILANRNPKAGAPRQIFFKNQEMNAGSNGNLHFFNRTADGNVRSASSAQADPPSPAPPAPIAQIQEIHLTNSDLSTPPPPVSQSDTGDKTEVLVVGDIAHSLKSLQAETSNLINRNGNPKSVVIRILKILLSLKQMLIKDGENDFRVLDRLHRYMVEKTLPALDRNQMPYKHENEFLTILESRLREAEKKHYA